METSATGHAVHRSPGILYPLMVIAAIAVILVSVAGIATMMGWMPGALSHNEAASRVAAAPAPDVAPPPASQRRAARMATAACRDCGVIESIRAVESKGEGTGLGAVAGGVVGGVLGNQIGRGNGRTAATVVGAGAGAFAGHEIEKSAKTSVTYQVRVRMQDGSYRTTYEQAQPGWNVGQKVRVTERGIVAAG